ncbi:hypothetical protein K439DRAFT_919528 [Ramaria rubella]|nr:hypothetical protein K439DRAFT_919528 [Ramaria rubella]
MGLKTPRQCTKPLAIAYLILRLMLCLASAPILVNRSNGSQEKHWENSLKVLLNTLPVVYPLYNRFLPHVKTTLDVTFLRGSSSSSQYALVRSSV